MTEGWAVWHPKHGFDIPYYEGLIVHGSLDDAARTVRDLNADDGTTNRTGWRAVKVTVAKVER